MGVSPREPYKPEGATLRRVSKGEVTAQEFFKSPGMLVGWDAIAEYLGVCKATAVKYHKNWGMPVIRIMRKRVLIHRDALTEWYFRLDRMQRRVISEVMETQRPGHNPKESGRRTWRRYVDSRTKAITKGPDGASLN